MDMRRELFCEENTGCFAIHTMYLCSVLFCRSLHLSSRRHFMESKFKDYTLFGFCTLLAVASCESQQQRYPSPSGYNLTKPKIYKMPSVLREISGIAFDQLNGDTLFTEQDENGKVFHFKLGDRNIQATRFFKNGDFEDIAICNHYVVMLRSDGVLFSFPVSETSKPETSQVKVFENLLPSGEYEG